MKKLTALLLVAVMALSMVSAFAAGSKTAADVPAVTPVNETKEEEIEEVPAGDLNVALVKTEAVDDTINDLKKLADEGAAPITYFPKEEVQDKVAEKLPAGVAAKDLEVKEVVGLSVEGVESLEGKVDAVAMAVSFTTPYNPSQTVFPVIGLVDAEGNVDWVLVEGTVQEDGSILLTIPAELLAKMAKAASVELAVLSTPLA